MTKVDPAKKAAGAVPVKQKAAAASKTAAAKPPVKRPAKPAAAKVKAVPVKPKAASKPAPAKPAPVAAPAPQPVAKPVVAPKSAKPAAASLNGHAGAPQVKAEKKPAEQKLKKPKLVRDSFTMPEAEYQVLGDVKKACLKAGIEAKKSELLRVGVALLKQLDQAKLKAALAALPPLKAGRPKKEK